MGHQAAKTCLGSCGVCSWSYGVTFLITRCIAGKCIVDRFWLWLSLPCEAPRGLPWVLCLCGWLGFWWVC